MWDGHKMRVWQQSNSATRRMRRKSDESVRCEKVWWVHKMRDNTKNNKTGGNQRTQVREEQGKEMVCTKEGENTLQSQRLPPHYSTYNTSRWKCWMTTTSVVGHDGCPHCQADQTVQHAPINGTQRDAMKWRTSDCTEWLHDAGGFVTGTEDEEEMDCNEEEMEDNTTQSTNHCKDNKRERDNDTMTGAKQEKVTRVGPASETMWPTDEEQTVWWRQMKEKMCCSQKCCRGWRGARGDDMVEREWFQLWDDHAAHVTPRTREHCNVPEWQSRTLSPGGGRANAHIRNEKNSPSNVGLSLQLEGAPKGAFREANTG